MNLEAKLGTVFSSRNTNTLTGRAATWVWCLLLLWSILRNTALDVQVLNMFEKAEAEYETLTGKKRIVSNDKTKIEKVLSPPHRAS